MALITEKDRRIYYQNIVYHVCNQLDVYAGETVVCGTAECPSTEVQDALRRTLSRLENEKRAAYNEKTEDQ